MAGTTNFNIVAGPADKADLQQIADNYPDPTDGRFYHHELRIEATNDGHVLRGTFTGYDQYAWLETEKNLLEVLDGHNIRWRAHQHQRDDFEERTWDSDGTERQWDTGFLQPAD